MRWDASPQAGFTCGQPWLPVGDGYTEMNVATEKTRGDSILSLYRRLIDLRRVQPALHSGNYISATTSEHVICYIREYSRQKLWIALNLSGSPQSCRAVSGRILLSTHLDREGGHAGNLELRPAEGVILEP